MILLYYTGELNEFIMIHLTRQALQLLLPQVRACIQDIRKGIDVRRNLHNLKGMLGYLQDDREPQIIAMIERKENPSRICARVLEAMVEIVGDTC